MSSRERTAGTQEIHGENSVLLRLIVLSLASRVHAPTVFSTDRGQRRTTLHGGPDSPSAKPFSCSNDAHVLSYFTSSAQPFRHLAFVSRPKRTTLFRIFAFLRHGPSIRRLSERRIARLRLEFGFFWADGNLRNDY